MIFNGRVPWTQKLGSSLLRSHRCQRISHYKPGVGQNIALCASPVVGNSVVLSLSSFNVFSTLFIYLFWGVVVGSLEALREACHEQLIGLVL